MNLNLSQTEISEDDIWFFLLNDYPQANKLYRNPLRDDKMAGCKMMWNGSVWIFTDFARSKSYTYKTALSEYFGVPFTEALTRLKVFPVLQKNQNKKVPVIKSRSVIEPFPFLKDKIPSWTEKGKSYWKALGVRREQLERETTRTYDTWKFKLNDDIIVPDYPCFTYCFTESVYKIYQPYGKIKWLFNGSGESHWYLKRRSNVLWLNKSNKDLLVLENFVPYDLMCFANEGCYPFMLEETCKEYDKVIINMDNDTAGIKFTNKLLSLIPNSEAHYFPGKDQKDASDILLGYGEQTLKSLL